MSTTLQKRTYRSMRHLAGVLAGTAILLFAGSASALHPFPSFDPAYFYPGALPPVLELAPLDASSDHQDVDGKIIPAMEYASGKKTTIQDWYTGMPDGDLHLQLAGKMFLVGLRIAPGDCSNKGCSALFSFDEDREKTLAKNLPFGPEDRSIVVYWTDPSNLYVDQWSGAYPLGKLPADEAWPVSAKASLGADGRYNIELKVTLRTTAANTQPDLTPRTLPFGLAVGVIGKKSKGPGTKNMDPSYYVWPNEAYLSGGQWIGLPKYPYTWKTIQPVLPRAEKTGFLTFNTGLMAILPNAGDGTPHDFVAWANDSDIHVACFQEVWQHSDRQLMAELALSMGMYPVGRPQPCAGNDDSGCSIDEELENKYSGTGLLVQDTGLLLLSKSPVIASEVMQFGDNEIGCKGADCLEEKGAIWARVGTAQSKHQPACSKKPPVCPEPVYAGEEYIDVFCTHLQANCDQIADLSQYFKKIEDATGLGSNTLLEELGIGGDSSDLACVHNDDYKPVQVKQLAKLGQWIEEKRLSDRPAVLMGDFNINGRSYDDLKKGLAFGSMYAQAATSLGVYDRTEFEKFTEIYSDRHDIGLGFHSPIGPVIPVKGTDPVWIDEVADLALADPLLAVSTFGQSTMAGDNPLSYDPAVGARYDYVWVVPARMTGDELPYFAIGAATEEPHMRVFPDLGGNTAAPPSDHAAAYAGLEFVHLSELATYNPLKAHNVTQAVVNINTLSDDGMLAGGEDFYGYGFSYLNSFPSLQYNFKAPYDSDQVSVNWSLMETLQPGDVAGFWHQLMEDDPGGTTYDDWYDMQPWAGKNSVTDFDSVASRWSFYDDKQPNKVQLSMCLAGLVHYCMVVNTLQPIKALAGTAEESAIVTHKLDVSEK